MKTFGLIGSCTTLRSWFIIGSVLISGVVVGILISTWIFTVVIMVDYSSGAVGRRMLIGPILVWADLDYSYSSERLSEIHFDALKKGIEPWHTALVYHGRMNQYSPSLKTSGILHALRIMDYSDIEIGVDKRRIAKKQFLEKLNAGDIDGAIKYAENYLCQLNERGDQK